MCCPLPCHAYISCSLTRITRSPTVSLTCLLRHVQAAHAAMGSSTSKFTDATDAAAADLLLGFARKAASERPPHAGAQQAHGTRATPPPYVQKAKAADAQRTAGNSHVGPAQPVRTANSGVQVPRLALPVAPDARPTPGVSMGSSGRSTSDSGGARGAAADLAVQWVLQTRSALRADAGLQEQFDASIVPELLARVQKKAGMLSVQPLLTLDETLSALQRASVQLALAGDTALAAALLQSMGSPRETPVRSVVCKLGGAER
jgi:hypothetical protein